MTVLDSNKFVIDLLRERQARLEKELAGNRYNRAAKKELRKVNLALAAEEYERGLSGDDEKGNGNEREKSD